jgi:soluble lytic murein transglycosylase-like protein
MTSTYSAAQPGRRVNASTIAQGCIVQAVMWLGACAAAPAMAAAYECIDDFGHAYRLPQRIDLDLVRFRCERIDDSRADATHSEPRRYTSIMLTVPAREAASQADDVPLLDMPGVDASIAKLPGGPLDSLIERIAQRFGHDPHLMRAIVQVESAFNARAVSPKGAIGLMQVMPATARRYGWNEASSLFDPATNLAAGARYLSDLNRLFPDQIELVLAAYNAGEGAVIKRNYSIPPFPETQAYVRSVLRAYALSRAGVPSKFSAR